MDSRLRLRSGQVIDARIGVISVGRSVDGAKYVSQGCSQIHQELPDSTRIVHNHQTHRGSSR